MRPKSFRELSGSYQKRVAWTPEVRREALGAAEARYTARWGGWRPVSGRAAPGPRATPPGRAPGRRRLSSHLARGPRAAAPPAPLRRVSRRATHGPQEDEKLEQLVAHFGTSSWPDVAAELPGRTSKSCSLRCATPR
jgi:hypothetical protein